MLGTSVVERERKRKVSYIFYIEEIGKRSKEICAFGAVASIYDASSFIRIYAIFTPRHFNPSYRRNEKIMKNDGEEIGCLKRNVLSF